MTRVLVVGAGGLGGPIAMALASSGVATRICDSDSVELSNLQRQIQFTIDDLGKAKASALAERVRDRGHEAVESANRPFESATAASLLHGVDLVIDGSDSFATKFEVNDQAARRAIPAVIASAIGTGGQVVAVAPGGGCYRCFFEEPPERETGSCANAGIVGATCAVIAGEAVRAASALLAGESVDPLVVYDDVTGAAEPRRIQFEPRPGCTACAPREKDRAS